MAVPNLNDLVQTATQPSILATELSIGSTIGLPVTAWQPLGIARDILYINAQVVSQYSVAINLIAQGGYLSYAALMKDANGNDITSWEDLVGVNNYNVSRIPPTFAATDASGFSVTNSVATPLGPYSPGQLHFENPVTQKTYTNAANVTIAGNTSTGVALVADEVGAASTSGPSTITQIVSPTLPNCTCTNTASLIGTDAESNAAYEQRCLAKLGALSPNGPPQAYYFVATSILDPLQPFYNASLSQAITRVTTITGPALVRVYIANAAGAPAGGDVTIVNAAIQAWAVPLGTTAIVAAATPVTIPITYTVYVPATANYTTAQIETAISDALAEYFSTLPIGGITDASTNVVPWSALLAVIASSNSSITSVTLTSPASDVSVAAVGVAILGSITPTVTRT